MLDIYFFSSGVVVGMEETSVEAMEDVGQRQLCASIMMGMLAKDVTVMVVHESGSALGV
jgi:hypothetical protein